MATQLSYIPWCPYRLITPEERNNLHQRRLAGEKKPADISFGDWMGPLKLKEQHLKYCILKAGGFLARNIARHYGLTESRLSIILSGSNCRRAIGELTARFSATALFQQGLSYGLQPEDQFWST